MRISKINLLFDVIEEAETSIKWKRKMYQKNKYSFKELIKKILTFS